MREKADHKDGQPVIPRVQNTSWRKSPNLPRHLREESDKQDQRIAGGIAYFAKSQAKAANDTRVLADLHEENPRLRVEITSLKSYLKKAQAVYREDELRIMQMKSALEDCRREYDEVSEEYTRKLSDLLKGAPQFWGSNRMDSRASHNWANINNSCLSFQQKPSKLLQSWFAQQHMVFCLVFPDVLNPTRLSKPPIFLITTIIASSTDAYVIRGHLLPTQSPLRQNQRIKATNVVLPGDTKQMSLTITSRSNEIPLQQRKISSKNGYTNEIALSLGTLQIPLDRFDNPIKMPLAT